MEKPLDSRALTQQDLSKLGYHDAAAEQIFALLQEEERLDGYLRMGARSGCMPITRANALYPVQVRKRLGLDAPGCLWAKGDISILKSTMLSLVGSRDLHMENRRFAELAGREAAQQGITLVSGNARGADQAAQDACLANGGRVISVVADGLQNCTPQENLLYISEDSFDLPFSAARALSRNRVIHALGYITLVARCNMGSGGTWDGTCRNLEKNWSPVFCFDDGSPASRELEQRGAVLISPSQLSDFTALRSNRESLF